MKMLVIVISALVAGLFIGSPSASAQPQPAPYIMMVCNINGMLYNIDQNYGIYTPNGYYMGQLVVASTPSGWLAIRGDGAQFPVFGCR